MLEWMNPRYGEYDENQSSVSVYGAFPESFLDFQISFTLSQAYTEGKKRGMKKQARSEYGQKERVPSHVLVS